MGVRKFARIGGIVMIVLGVLALIPSLSRDPVNLPYLYLGTSYGSFLGFFPMNIINKLAMIGFGIAGVVVSAADNVEPSVQYSRTVAIVMGLLAILGLIPATNTLFGYLPLFGGEIVTHGVFAILGGFFGYTVPMQARHDVEAKV